MCRSSVATYAARQTAHPGISNTDLPSAAEAVPGCPRLLPIWSRSSSLRRHGRHYRHLFATAEEPQGQVDQPFNAEHDEEHAEPFDWNEIPPHGIADAIDYSEINQARKPEG